MLRIIFPCSIGRCSCSLIWSFRELQVQFSLIETIYLVAEAFNTKILQEIGTSAVIEIAPGISIWFYQEACQRRIFFPYPKNLCYFFFWKSYFMLPLNLQGHKYKKSWNWFYLTSFCTLLFLKPQIPLYCSRATGVLWYLIYS